jgi:Spy/CpxP family protein refolding chaperone
MISKALLLGGAALLMSSVLLAAPKEPAAGDAPALHKGHGRLTKPWNELKDLTEDEKTKILAIHQKALDEIHEIEAKENTDILATLTDSQKKEVADIEAKDKAAAREGRSHKPTTQPVGAK